MLTEEQKQKARKAVFKDLEKVRALERHKKAVRSMDLYALPYRIYLDYLKRWDNMEPSEQDTTVSINPCYPDEGYPIDIVRVVTTDDLDIENAPRDKDGRLLYAPFDDIHTLKLSVRNEIFQTIEPLRKWRTPFDDNWRYAYSHFLKGYDIEHFTEFDFFGTNGEITYNDLDLFRKVYAHALNDYEDKVLGEYLEEEPSTTKERKKGYSDMPYRVLLDRGTLVERENLIEQMGIKPSYTEEEYRIVNGSEDDTEG